MKKINNNNKVVVDNLLHKSRNILKYLNTHFPNKESKHMRNIYNYVYYTKHVTILY
jgi:hemerythrin